MVFWSALFRFTDAHNTESELNQAEAAFANASQEILTWLHFNAADAAGKIDTVAVRYGDNLTPAQA